MVDQLFLTLYRELYFRHVYAKLEPNVDDRFQSYENICELFNLLLSEWMHSRLDPIIPLSLTFFSARRQTLNSPSPSTSPSSGSGTC